MIFKVLPPKWCIIIQNKNKNPMIPWALIELFSLWALTSSLFPNPTTKVNTLMTKKIKACMS